MPRCSIASCGNTYETTKLIPEKKHIKYHCFPKDPTVRATWKHRCSREDKFNLNHARICSDHFLNDDYVRDLRGELLALELRRQLKKDAVPSVNIGNRFKSNGKNIERKLRIMKRDRKKLVTDLLKSSQPLRGDLRHLTGKQSITSVQDKLIEASMIKIENKVTNETLCLNISPYCENIQTMVTFSNIKQEQQSQNFLLPNNDVDASVLQSTLLLCEELEKVKKEKIELEYSYANAQNEIENYQMKLEQMTSELSLKSSLLNSMKGEIERLQKLKMPIKES